MPDDGAFVYYDPEFWRAPDSSSGFNAAVYQEVHAYQDRHGFRGVVVTMKPEKRDAIERYTSKWLHRQLATMVDGEIIMAPVIETPLRDRLYIMTPGGSSESDQTLLVDRLTSQ